MEATKAATHHLAKGMFNMKTDMKKLAAVGAAGVIALGAAGLYAGSLTSTATGSLGASAIDIQAACTTSVLDITPGTSAWDNTTQKFVFNDLTVTAATASSLTQCEDQKVLMNVYNTTDGGQLSSNATAYTIDSDDVTANAFTVTLDTAVPADTPEADYNYGLVIQAP